MQLLYLSQNSSDNSYPQDKHHSSITTERLMQCFFAVYRKAGRNEQSSIYRAIYCSFLSFNNKFVLLSYTKTAVAGKQIYEHREEGGQDAKPPETKRSIDTQPKGNICSF